MEEARGRILTQLGGPSYTGKIPEGATLLVAEFEAEAKAEAVEHAGEAGAAVVGSAAPARVPGGGRRRSAAWSGEVRRVIRGGGRELEALVEGSGERARVVYRVGRPGRTVSFIDPDLGDRLIVVPVPTARPGLGVTRAFPQFRVLASRQGLVFQPLSCSLQDEVTANAVVLRDSAGLVVSRVSSVALVKSNGSAPRGAPWLSSLLVSGCPRCRPVGTWGC